MTLTFLKAQPEQRIAQRMLASEVVELVHGGIDVPQPGNVPH
jgi:hypothetical protein